MQHPFHNNNGLGWNTTVFSIDRNTLFDSAIKSITFTGYEHFI